MPFPKRLLRQKENDRQFLSFFCYPFFVPDCKWSMICSTSGSSSIRLFSSIVPSIMVMTSLASARAERPPGEVSQDVSVLTRAPLTNANQSRAYASVMEVRLKWSSLTDWK